MCKSSFINKLLGVKQERQDGDVPLLGPNLHFLYSAHLRPKRLHHQHAKVYSAYDP